MGSDGGLVEEYLGDATTMFEKMIKLNMGEQKAKEFKKSPQGKKFVEGEAHRIAGVLTRWQSNSRDFPMLGGGAGKISALFRLGSKMNHSCEPNCIMTVEPEKGVAVM